MWRRQREGITTNIWWLNEDEESHPVYNGCPIPGESVSMEKFKSESRESGSV